jgi:4-aminobutyrate aminotransferase-like enzyme
VFSGNAKKKLAAARILRPSLQVCKAAFDNKLLLITAGSRATIRFLPPLICQEEDIARGLEKLEAAMKQVFDDTHRSASGQ